MKSAGTKSSRRRRDNNPVAVLDAGLIYQDANRHQRHAYFPSLATLPCGDVVCGLDIASSMTSPDRRSFVCRSSDGGKTWSEPIQMFEPDHSVRRVSTSCRIARVNGELMGLACLFDRTNADAGHTNPQTEGFVRTDMSLVRSRDGGRSWTAPSVLAPAISWHHFEICSPPVLLGGGRVVAPTSIWPNWEGRCEIGAYRAIAFVSDDGGRTWPHVANVMDLTASGCAAWEQRQVQLTDGRVLAVCWQFRLSDRKSLHNCYAISTDNGLSFAPPQSCPILGETCVPVALADNRLLCLYRRVDVQGLWAHLAQIEGNRWIPLADAPVWGTRTNAYGQSGDGLMRRFDTLQFGCPALMRRDDDTILAALWCVEDGLAVIRRFILALSDG